MSVVAKELDLAAVTAELSALDAEARLRWAADTFGDQLTVLSSMQKTASVVMHLMYRLGLDHEILFVDTGYHFPETLQLRDEFMRKYKLNLVTLYPHLTPEQQEKKFDRKLYLFVDGQPVCCDLRKKDPFLNYVRAHHKVAVAKGLRQGEGGSRGNLRPISADPEVQGYALHPIFDWTEEQVDAYCATHAVPVHPLHAQSYPSIGCECCTTPVAPGESARAGRWRHLRPEGDQTPMYCNINFSDGGGI